jgi:hypothetical protein
MATILRSIYHGFKFRFPGAKPSYVSTRRSSGLFVRLLLGSLWAMLPLFSFQRIGRWSITRRSGEGCWVAALSRLPAFRRRDYIQHLLLSFRDSMDQRRTAVLVSVLMVSYITVLLKEFFHWRIMRSAQVSREEG